MGFSSYIGGLALCAFAVLLAILGFIVIFGLISLVPTSFNLFLGLALLVIALVLFLYGRYLFKSASPKGTVNVHNV
jgi:high-affinity Fe2+/Pb2+ permease